MPNETPSSPQPDAPGGSNPNPAEGPAGAPVALTAFTAETPTPAPTTLPTEPTSPALPGEWTPALLGIAALVAVLGLLLGSFSALNSDIWLNLAAGRLLAEGNYTFGVDPFSWASSGSYWANPSWLSSWLAYGIYTSLGPASLVAIKAFAVAVLAILMMATRTPERPILPFLQLAGLALVVASPRFFLQPTVISFLGVGVLMWLLLRHGALAAESGEVRFSSAILWQVPLLLLAWSNLDGYFILGLVILALAAVGLLTAANTRAPATRLLAALGLSVVACALNPHGLANFALPTELAHLLHGVLPAGWAPAGDTMAALAQGETPGLFGMVSPFSATYMNSPVLGWNIAGMSYYILLLLNVASFIVAGLRPGTPGLLARGLICLVLAILGAMQIRLIPFYAIVAGPVTAVNWTDFLRGSGKAPITSGDDRLGGLLTGLALLVGIALAWPGWLHLGFSDFRDDRLFAASRRVAWELNPDASMRNSAKALSEWREAGEAGHVFNTAPDIAHYVAFFAPGVKCGFDLRLALFASIAPAYTAARNDLWAEADDFLKGVVRSARTEKDKGPPPVWPAKFTEWGVDQVALTSFHQAGSTRNGRLGTRLLYDPKAWWPRWADGRTLVFRWSPQRNWRGDELREQWMKAVFAPQDHEGWLPDNEPVSPPAEPTWIEQYAYGSGATPSDFHAARFHLGALQRATAEWKGAYLATWQWAQTLPVGGLAGAAPGSILGVHGVLFGMYMPARLVSERIGPEPDLIHSLDFGVPALPILTQRDLRRALLENAKHSYSHALQSQAVKATLQQETWWTRHQATNLRTMIRTFQFAAALRNALTLSPDHYDALIELRDHLLGLHYIDAALEPLDRAIEILEGIQASDPNQLRAIRAQKDELQKQAKAIRQEVQRRKADLDLKTAGASDMEKYRHAARYPWRFIDRDNKEQVDQRGRGLPVEAVRILERMNPDRLSPQEKMERVQFLVQAYCNMGRIDEAIKAINRGGPDLGPIDAECRAWVSAATGWYKNLDAALTVLEGGVKEQMALQAGASRDLLGLGVSLSSLGQMATLPRISYGLLIERIFLEQRLQQQRPVRVLADFQTLRGIFALERGDSAGALAFFEEALRSDTPFNDQAIAMRYRDLLRQYAK